MVAHVSDPDAWDALSEVRIGTSIPDSAAGALVTARIPLQRVDYVRQQPFVKCHAQPHSAALLRCPAASMIDQDAVHRLGEQGPHMGWTAAHQRFLPSHAQIRLVQQRGRL